MAGTKHAAVGTEPRELTGHDFAVILEDLRSQFRVFGEALQSLREEMNRRFEYVEKRLDSLETRMENVETRLEKVETRLEKVEMRLEKVETRLDGLERENVAIKIAVLDVTHELKSIKGDLREYCAG